MRPDDELVTLLSQWLARHVDGGELRTALSDFDGHGLSEHQRAAIAELRAELDRGTDSGELEMVVRETLESLALG